MGWEFWLALAIGEFLILLQGIAAYKDGFLTHAQMLYVHNICDTEGYSFMNHGGMWSDFFLITPLSAYLIEKYTFTGDFYTEIFIGVVALLLWLALAVFVYAPSGIKMPEAYTHSGDVTVAGWLHVIYAAVATSVIAMMYIGMVTPTISHTDIIIMSSILSVWAYLGVVKFTSNWSFWENKIVMSQVAVEIAGIWLITWCFW